MKTEKKGKPQTLAEKTGVGGGVAEQRENCERQVEIRKTFSYLKGHCDDGLLYFGQNCSNI